MNLNIEIRRSQTVAISAKVLRVSFDCFQNGFNACCKYACVAKPSYIKLSLIDS